MKNYVQDGEALDYTNTSGATITSGSVIVIGTLIGVAVDDIADTLTGAVRVNGVVSLPKAATTVFAQGDELDFDVSASQFDNIGTPAAGDLIDCCVAAYAAANGDATVDVILNQRGAVVTP